MKEDEIERLQKVIDDDRIHITEIKARNGAEMQKISQEMNEQNALLQIEKNKIRELEDERKITQR